MRSILDRVNTLAFDSSLMREMRMIRFVTELIDKGHLDGSRYTRIFIHTIDAEAELSAYHPSSKLNADHGFLRCLFEIDADKADAFLNRNFDAIGQRSSTDVEATFC